MGVYAMLHKHRAIIICFYALISICTHGAYANNSVILHNRTNQTLWILLQVGNNIKAIINPGQTWTWNGSGSIGTINVLPVNADITTLQAFEQGAAKQWQTTYNAALENTICNFIASMNWQVHAIGSTIELSYAQDPNNKNQYSLSYTRAPITGKFSILLTSDIHLDQKHPTKTPRTILVNCRS